MSDATEALARANLLKSAFSDFAKFCALLLVKTKSGASAPFVLNSIQRKYIANKTLRDIVLKPRQIGMTTLMIALDLFIFLTRPGSNVVIVCQSKSDNKPLNDLATQIDDHLDRLEVLGIKFDWKERKKGSWKLVDTNSSLSIVAAGASPKSAEKVGRSGMVTHLHCTEIAFWDQAGDSWNAISNCVPETEFGSSVVWETTPNGASGLFYEEFMEAIKGNSEYKSHFFPWYEQQEHRKALDPGEVIQPSNELEEKLEPEQVKWYRQKSRGERGHLVKQEYPSDPYSCFLGIGRSFFEMSVVLPMITTAINAEAPDTYTVSQRTCRIAKTNMPPDGVAKTRTVRIFHKPMPGREYVVSLDPSEGVGLDRGAGIVLERGTGRHTASIWGQFRPEELAAVAVSVAKEYNSAEIAFERANHGHAVRVALTSGAVRWNHLFRDHDGKLGWVNTFQSRTLALDHIEEAVRKGHFTSLDVHLLSEMKDFIVKETAGGKNRADHERGKHDDLLLATTIGWSVISRRRVFRDLSNLPPA
jgi:hypothetical protein